MFLILAVVAVVTNVELEPIDTPEICFPPCPLPPIGVDLCQNLVEFSGCTDSVDSLSETNSRLKQSCGCQWDHVLKKFNKNGNQTTKTSKAFQDCHAYVKRLCITSRLGLNNTDWLTSVVQSMRREKSRISGLKNKHERHAARTALIEKIDEYMSSLITNNSHGSAIDKKRPKGTTENVLKSETTATTDSNTDTFSTSESTSAKNHKTKLHPMKNDDQMKILFFSCVVMTILFIFVCALLGKLKYDSSEVGFSKNLVGDLHIDEEQLKQETKKKKCWDTFLDKLRLRYKEKAEENKTRDLQPMTALDPVTGSIASNHPFIEKTSGGARSNDEDEKSTLVRLYASRSSDTNNEEEDRLFHTKLTRDYGSAINNEQK